MSKKDEHIVTKKDAAASEYYIQKENLEFLFEAFDKFRSFIITTERYMQRTYEVKKCYLKDRGLLDDYDNWERQKSVESYKKKVLDLEAIDI